MSDVSLIKTPELIIVDKKFTRTYEQKDSLVSNLRRVLPRSISVDVFENKIIPQISEEETQFLLNYYVKRKASDGHEAYLLRTIPHRLGVENGNKILSDLNEEDRNFVTQFYSIDETQNRFILQTIVSEANEIKLLKMFNMKNLHINNVQKTLISEILEKIEDVHKKDTFYSNIYIPTDHVYFSPPNLKHISGMCITEAARQFAIACCHQFGKVPFDDVTFLLQNLTSEFYQYAKIAVPIKMKAKALELKHNKDKSWNYVDLEIFVYQENVEISKVSTKATILPLKVYKRLKSNQEEVYEIDPRFIPSAKFKNNISIRYQDGDKTKKWVCHIDNFSKTGFLVKSEGSAPPKQITQNESLEFFMHFDLAGFVHGNCKMIWMMADKEQDDHYLVGFQILNMTGIDSENLAEAISRYGKLIEDREII